MPPKANPAKLNPLQLQHPDLAAGDCADSGRRQPTPMAMS